MIVALGAVFILLAVLSRLFSLAFYRRISQSPSRPVTPSQLPRTPWLRVQSDQTALKVIVALTYGGIVLGMLLLLVGGFVA